MLGSGKVCHGGDFGGLLPNAGSEHRPKSETARRDGHPIRVPQPLKPKVEKPLSCDGRPTAMGEKAAERRR